MRTPPAAFLSASTALGLAVALTACSGGDSDDQTLTYWASNQGASVEEDQEVLQPALDRFTEETGVEVELEVIPWSELYNRILTAVSSGDAPDVLNIGNTWAASLQETGAFVPFEGEDLDAVGGEERYVSTSFATGGAEGQPPTSVPLYGLSYALFYNPTMFEEAGIDEPPATWDEFVEVANELTTDTDDDGEIDQYGFALEGGNERENSHMAFIFGQQQGGALWGEAGPTFSSDEQVTAVKEWVDLMAEEEVVDPSSAEFTDGTQGIGDFVDERAAMIIVQGSARTTMAARDFDNYEVAQVPMFDPLPGEPIQSHAAGINISVFEDTDNREGALQLVNHLTSPEEQVYLSQEFQTLPVSTESYDSEELQSESMETFRTILAEHSAPMPLIPEEGQMETVLGEAIGGLFAEVATGGEVTEDDVRQAMEEAETQMDAAN